MPDEPMQCTGCEALVNPAAPWCPKCFRKPPYQKVRKPHDPNARDHTDLILNLIVAALAAPLVIGVVGC